MTFSKPKPLVEFANKPILEHQIEALVKAGVQEIVLAVNVEPEAVMAALKVWEKTVSLFCTTNSFLFVQYGIKITSSIESEPMGTAGPIRLAEKHLTEGNESGMFFVFNADVICEYPLLEMIEFHKTHGQQGTIAVY